MVRNLLLALGLVAGLSAWLAHGAADAADPAFCGKYASDAMKAVSQANYLKCGFKGPRWTGDKKNHLAWCLFVPSSAAKFETNPPFSAMQNEMDIRKKMLKGC